MQAEQLWGKRGKREMSTTTVVLWREQRERLDRAAKARQLNRSEALRQAVELWLGRNMDSATSGANRDEEAA